MFFPCVPREQGLGTVPVSREHPSSTKKSNGSEFPVSWARSHAGHLSKDLGACLLSSQGTHKEKPISACVWLCKYLWVHPRDNFRKDITLAEVGENISIGWHAYKRTRPHAAKSRTKLHVVFPSRRFVCLSGSFSHLRLMDCSCIKRGLLSIMPQEPFTPLSLKHPPALSSPKL